MTMATQLKKGRSFAMDWPDVAHTGFSAWFSHLSAPAVTVLTFVIAIPLALLVTALGAVYLRRVLRKLADDDDSRKVIEALVYPAAKRAIDDALGPVAERVATLEGRVGEISSELRDRR